MEQFKIYVKIGFRISASIFPIFIGIYIFYKIFDINLNINWLTLLLTCLTISITSIPHYKNTVVRISLKAEDEFIESFKDNLYQGPWTVIRENKEELEVQPKFDLILNWMFKEKINIVFTKDYIQVEGAKVYVEKIKDMINNKRSLWDKKAIKVLAVAALIFFILLPVFIDRGVIFKIENCYNEFRIRNIEKINFPEKSTLGNRVNNINNYGGAVESKNYIFYVEDNLNLWRSDKDFNNETLLIGNTSGFSISYLNIIDDWIFYRRGKTINRMKIDGSNNEKLHQLGFILDIHVLDNWIYFIRFNDNSKIYKMNVNGQNLQKVSDISVEDISIYDNRIYYSYENNGEHYLESMSLIGENKQSIANIPADNLVIKNENYYYIDYTDYKLYKYNKKYEESKKIVDERVSQFLIVDNWIYYSVHSEDVGYPGTGLFRIDINGENKEVITKDTSIEELNRVGDWILFSSSEGNSYPSLKRMRIGDNKIIEIN